MSDPFLEPFIQFAGQLLPAVQQVCPDAVFETDTDMPCVRLPDGASIVTCDGVAHDLWTAPQVQAGNEELGYIAMPKRMAVSRQQALAFASRHTETRPYHPESATTDVPMELVERPDPKESVERFLADGMRNT